MKPIIFTHEDFLWIKHLKHCYTKISIKLHDIGLNNTDIQSFQSEFSAKIQDFLELYDVLNQKMYFTNEEYSYVTGDLANLGVKCFEVIDEIGMFLDNKFEKFSSEIKNQFKNCLLYVYW